MKYYTANYSTTNHNFVIQNLESKRNKCVYLPAILILKNILQRGKPTLMSKFLQSEIGPIHNYDNYNKPFTLIDKELPIWQSTIKGDNVNNYYPAKIFYEQVIQRELPEYDFIIQLIRPETPINEITQKSDERFKHQQVDFYLPQAFLVIEIDGQQHKTSEAHRISDTERDSHLNLHQVQTVRINSIDLEKNNSIFRSKIEEIRQRLENPKYNKFLEFYRHAYEIDFHNLPQEIKEKKLLPTAIVRFQILVLELLENGQLQLDDDKWTIEIKDHDITDYANIAIQDLFIWLNHLLKLQKINFVNPDYIIQNFSKGNNIQIDFSLLKRWTDENRINKNVIYVRTDYFDIYYDRVTQTNERISNFRLSTTEPVNYKLIKDGTNNDLQHLQFFLENIFDHSSFMKGQYPIIENALARRDTIGLLPTGGGKSLTYQLACLLQPSISFVVCPIKSLMFDQKRDLENAYFQNVETITGDITGEERRQILDNFGNGKYFFVFISPERFQTQDFRDRLSAINDNYSFAYAVIDEVHCLSEWGHDFRTSYLNLSRTIKKHCRGFKYLGLTATASSNVLKDIQIEFDIKQEDVITLLDYTRPNLEFIVVKDKGNKADHLQRLIKEKYIAQNAFKLRGKKTKCGLIFTPNVNGKFGCYPLANMLKKEIGIEVRSYSGSQPKDYSTRIPFDKYKIEVQNDFKDNKFSLLTATKAFGMGINKPNIDYTFHYGIPSSMEALYQEAGRAGRNKQKSECYILLSEETKDIEKLFSPSATYEEIRDLTQEINWNGEDVIRQIFLYQLGLEPLEKELELILDLYTRHYSQTNSKAIITGKDLGVDKGRVEKAIYRLSNVGIVKDWTIENFFGGGVFTVYFDNFTNKSIQHALLKYIKKYDDNFEFDNKEMHHEYTQIYHRSDLSTLVKTVLILLKWSYDKFAYNRRQSLENVYRNSVDYEDTPEGRANYKKSLEAYFKFTQVTYVLSHIAENNDNDFDKWFEIFYDKEGHFISNDKLIELEGNVLRFLESYQNNTGLNLINALVILLLDKSLVDSHEERLKSALQTISTYKQEDHDFIMAHISSLIQQLGEQNTMTIRNYLLADSNSRLKVIIERFNNGLR